MPAKKITEATYEDLFSVPENMVGEIIDGELFTQRRPAAPHAIVTSRLFSRIGGFDDDGSGRKPGGWVLLFEPELHLGPRPDILVPDIAGWTRTRMPVIPDDAYFTLAPDWVCEILSAGTESKDRIRKMSIYAREKIAYVWLVNPTLQTLEVYRQGKEHWELLGSFGGAEVVRTEPFDAMELDLATLWAR